jgi:hypothetical protein
MTTFYSQTDLPLCEQDMTVAQIIDHGVEIKRKLFAGQRVPADLIEAYHAATGDEPVADESATGPDYSKMTPEDLRALVDERQLQVQGSGANGNIIKTDLVNALVASDSAD